MVRRLKVRCKGHHVWVPVVKISESPSEILHLNVCTVCGWETDLKSEERCVDIASDRALQKQKKSGKGSKPST
jgi:hypothetical protein